MKSLIAVLISLALIAVGCVSTHAPVTPENDSPGIPTPDEVLTYLDDALENGFGEDRHLAFVDPGSDMSPDELRIYFAVNIVETNFPPYIWCPVYQIVKNVFTFQSDATVNSWVVVMESNGYDVPDKDPDVPIPPYPIC